MTFRDFRIGWRLLLLQPAHSAIVVLGMALGLAVSFLILAQLYFSFTVDRHVPGAEQVYVVKSRANWDDARWSASAPMPAKEVAEQSGLALAASRVVGLSVPMRVGDVVQNVALNAVDASYAEVFGLRAREGDLRAALTRPDALALTRETARRLFGDSRALGRSVLIAGTAFQVAAILDDTPDNASLPLAALAGIGTAAWDGAERRKMLADWGDTQGLLYLRLGAGAAPQRVAQLLSDAAERSPLRAQLTPEQSARLGGARLLDVALGPLLDAYLDKVARSSQVKVKKGKTILLAAMAGVAVLVLLLATINYVNLVTVRTIGRQREIAVRKVLGASGWRVLRQMLAESMLVCLLAGAAGMLLAWLLLPGFGALVGLRLDALLTPDKLLAGAAAGMALALAVGALAALYPARLALGMHPAATLGGRGSEAAGGNWLRRGLTVLQFAVGMGFASIAITMAWQMHFMNALDFGFDPEPLLVLDLPLDMEAPASQSFHAAVARLPGVSQVAMAEDGIGQSYNIMKKAGVAGAEAIMMRTMPVSPEYFALFGARPLAGRLFDAATDPAGRTGLIVLDAGAVAQLGFASPAAALGQVVTLRDAPQRIVGVSAALLTQNVLAEHTPTIYELGRNTHTMIIKTAGGADAPQGALAALWRQHYPNHLLNVMPMRRLLAAPTRQIAPLLQILTLATGVAVALAAFGMYILSAFSLQRRAREIVLRKLFGAGPADIARLVGREFLLLIGVAAALSLPPAYFAGQSFLEECARQAPVGPWAALAALAGAVLVALLSSSRHTLAAMRVAPALALRA
ncbi:ABC transporter permease [Janthinobacterium fluminis]|uniref:ABC transporter permease n=1 Tax=Janthinobacterium fluminis TaxID=2987524 RepID=A0ABT5K7C2_9BURK|nr:FtsX-like permease family protein [Janthinobacterium fluminis]MDC8759657.1 ABC transporter permease [Janthinobacterium fluminis]